MSNTPINPENILFHHTSSQESFLSFSNKLAENRHQIIIVEENQKSAGIGSAIIEVLSDAYNNGLLKTYPKIQRIAINDEFLEVAGSQRYLQQTAGLILWSLSLSNLE